MPSQQTPELLRRSGTALSLLTNRPVKQDVPISDSASRVQIIEDTSYQFFVLVNQMRALLHNQINELQNENVIPAEATRFIPAPTIRPGMGAAVSAEEERRQRNPEANVINGGLGHLNIADLNARAGVKQQGDDDVLDRLQGILDDLSRRAQGEHEEMKIYD
jgi:hypothetical protein